MKMKENWKKTIHYIYLYKNIHRNTRIKVADAVCRMDVIGLHNTTSKTHIRYIFIFCWRAIIGLKNWRDRMINFLESLLVWKYIFFGSTLNKIFYWHRLKIMHYFLCRYSEFFSISYWFDSIAFLVWWEKKSKELSLISFFFSMISCFCVSGNSRYLLNKLFSIP